MMSFCQKNNVQFSFLPSPNSTGNGTVDLDSLFHHHHHHHHHNSCLESLLFSRPSSSRGEMMAFSKRDSGGIGFMDDFGGIVDGLMSCTESLGFESSDERRVDDWIGNGEGASSGGNWKWKRENGRREVKKFPPPLSSLDQNGKPTFFLRPVRKDGKLELQEVKISRPEILFASRQDGRLRLHLISNEEEEDCAEQINEENGEEEEGLIQEMEYTEEEGVEEWQIPASLDSGEGLRNCHEQVTHHHQNRRRRRHHQHYALHVWRQHCVT